MPNDIQQQLEELRENFFKHRHLGEADRTQKLTGTSGGRIHVKVFDDITSATTGDGKFIFAIHPDYDGRYLLSVMSYVSTSSSSGALTIQVRNTTQGIDMLSTASTIDQSETTSLTAATPSVVNTTNARVDEGDLIAIDVDGAGTGAKGLGVILKFA